MFAGGNLQQVEANAQGMWVGLQGQLLQPRSFGCVLGIRDQRWGAQPSVLPALPGCTSLQASD